MTSPTLEQLTELKQFASCDVADALLVLKHPHPLAGYLPDIVMHSPEYCAGDTRLVGPAYTVKLVPKSDTTSPTPSQHFVDAAPPNSIIFISAPSDVKNAVWGGLMMTRALHIPILGAIIDGRVRDLAEQRAAHFPVFARSTSILGAGPYTRPSELNVPITLADGQTINPGDVIVADLDGVVVVPKDWVPRVIEECQKGAEITARCMEDLNMGKGIKETFKKWRG